jgi:hypothetical protein
MHTRSRLGVSLALAIGLALIAVPTAEALDVKGHQTQVGRGAKYEMTGGLNGKWKVTHFLVRRRGPLYKVTGRERFNGCVDVARDGSCNGDPTGKLEFRFRYWERFNDDGGIDLGTCAHRIVDSSDGLAGTTGFLMMVDLPTATAAGYKTIYEGFLDVPGFARRGHAATPPTC